MHCTDDQNQLCPSIYTHISVVLVYNYNYLKDRFNYEYLTLRFGYPSHFAGTNNCGMVMDTHHRRLPLV